MSGNGLPKGWSTKAIGDISTNIHYGYTASASKSAVGPKMLRITDIQDSQVQWNDVPYCKIEKAKKSKYLLKPGDLVFARTGATVGKSFLIPEQIPESVFASYLIRIILDQSVDPKYVYNFFQSNLYWRQIRQSQRGIGQPNVNATILSQIQLPLPDVEVQHRIVAKIEELFTRLDAGVEELKKVKAQLKQYRQSVLKHAFEGKLTQEWREAQLKDPNSPLNKEPAAKLLEKIEAERRQRLGKKYKPPKPIDTSNLPKLPKGWVWAMIEHIGFVTKLAGFEYTKYVKYTIDGDIPVIKAENIGKNGFRSTEFSRVKSQTVNDLKRSRLKADDVLMVFIGAGLGQVGRVPNDQQYFLGPNVALIRPEINDVLPYYIEYYLRSHAGFAATLAQSKSTAQPSTSMAQIRKIPIPIPSIAEQTSIVENIQNSSISLNHAIIEVDRMLMTANGLRRSVLTSAFIGKLQT